MSCRPSHPKTSIESGADQADRSALEAIVPEIVANRRAICSLIYPAATASLSRRYPSIDRDTLMDALQQSALAYLEHAPEPVAADERKSMAYLMITAVREIRRLKMRSVRLVEIPLDGDDLESLPFAGLLAALDPAIEAMSDDTQGILNRISPLLAETVRLHVLDGFTVHETAGVLGINEKAAKQRLWRAYRALRRIARIRSAAADLG